MKTKEVKILIQDVLNTIPKPYSHEIVDTVFFEIEHNPVWLRKYEHLSSVLGKDVVNQWGGKWVAIILGKDGDRQVSRSKSTLIGSYTSLDTDARKKPNEEDALNSMHEYYKIHKSDLPINIVDYRENIKNLIISGLTVEDAFFEAMDNQGSI